MQVLTLQINIHELYYQFFSKLHKQVMIASEIRADEQNQYQVGTLHSQPECVADETKEWKFESLQCFVPSQSEL